MKKYIDEKASRQISLYCFNMAFAWNARNGNAATLFEEGSSLTEQKKKKKHVFKDVQLYEVVVKVWNCI